MLTSDVGFWLPFVSFNGFKNKYAFPGGNKF